MNFLIAAGGTGQEIAAAVIRVSYLTNTPVPQIVAIDSDIGSEQKRSKTRHQVVDQLHNWMTSLRIEPAAFFRTVNPAHVTDQDETAREVRTVEDIFTIHGDLVNDDRDILELLLTENQKHTSIADGFHGQPAVGALVVAVSSKLGDWSDVNNEIRRHAERAQGCRILVAGSVTGGVGTATLPTVIKEISQFRGGNDRVAVCGLLQLPWFTLKKIESDPNSQEPDVLDSMMDRNAACLIQGYLKQLVARELDNVLLLGLPAKVTRPSDGGSRQRETKHFLNVISGVQALCMLDAAEHKRLFAGNSGLFGMALADEPRNHYHGGAGGPAFKQFTVDRLCAVARCLVAFSEAVCFELECLTPSVTHQGDIHSLLTGLSQPEREALRKSMRDFRDLHREIWEWLVTSLEAKVGEQRADAGLNAFLPESRDANGGVWERLRDSSTKRALSDTSAPMTMLALGRRLIARFGPFEVDKDHKGDPTAWGVVQAARGKIYQQVMGT